MYGVQEIMYDVQDIMFSHYFLYKFDTEECSPEPLKQ